MVVAVRLLLHARKLRGSAGSEPMAAVVEAAACNSVVVSAVVGGDDDAVSVLQIGTFTHNESAVLVTE